MVFNQKCRWNNGSKSLHSFWATLYCTDPLIYYLCYMYALVFFHLTLQPSKHPLIKSYISYKLLHRYAYGYVRVKNNDQIISVSMKSVHLYSSAQLFNAIPHNADRDQLVMLFILKRESRGRKKKLCPLMFLSSTFLYHTFKCSDTWLSGLQCRKGCMWNPQTEIGKAITKGDFP